MRLENFGYDIENLGMYKKYIHISIHFGRMYKSGIVNCMIRLCDLLYDYDIPKCMLIIRPIVYILKFVLCMIMIF